ncbi:MAG: agmatine deiminase family protein, partial [Candidatus Latescibacteria bacterium]|nr:agmatine deiminase family protein [Candidatus Latescibacterota bacterium]
MKLPQPTPASLGFRMPAEWEPHAATWLSWPHKEESWPGKFDPVPSIFIEIVKALSPHEHIHINVCDDRMEAELRSRLQQTAVHLNAISFHRIPTNDAWIRDYGPTFLTRRVDGRTERAVVDWGYNAWGGKYPHWEEDDAVPTKISTRRRLPLFEPGIVMEGGSLDVNGKGTVLTTTSCLLNENRNPCLSQKEIEGYLRAYLGVSNTLWLGEGIVGDDTDGHIDDLSRFVNPTTVVTVVEEDPADDNHKILQENLRRLRTMRDQDNRPLEVVTMPMPTPMFYEGRRLPASYANFYIANGVVLVPTFNDPHDAHVLTILQALFPSRRIVGIDCTDLIWGLGAVHCVTQQEPAVN